MLIGKESICNRCGAVFLLNMYSITLVKPHCDDCTIKRGNHFEARIKVNVSELTTPISAVVSNSIAVDSVAELEQRLRSASFDVTPNQANDNLIIKTYNPESEDEL